MEQLFILSDIEQLINDYNTQIDVISNISLSSNYSALDKLESINDALNRVRFDEKYVVQFGHNKEMSAYNNYFHIAYVNHSTPKLVFVSGLLKSYQQLLTHTVHYGTSLTKSDFEALHGVFQNIILFLQSNELQWHDVSLTVNQVNPYPAPTQKATVNHTHLPEISLTRWRLGHHTFFILIQSLILVLKSFQQAMQENRWSDAKKFLNFASSLMYSVTIVMRFTSDFPIEIYTKVIRPSMSVPQCKVDLSGLMGKDHKYFISVLSLLKPIFKKIPVELKAHHDTFAQVLAYMYDCHKWVCGQFVGDKPSLLSAHRSNKTSVVLLDKFKRSRLKLVFRSSDVKEDEF